MASVLDPKLAIGLIVIPVMVTNFQIAFQRGWKGFADAAMRFWPLIATCSVTLFIVALLAARLTSGFILVVIGVVLLIFVALNTLPLRPRIPPHLEKSIGAGAGVIAGLMGGATSVYGPPITMFLLASGVRKENWNVSVGVTFGLGSLPLFAGYLLNGFIDGSVAVVSIFSCLPAFLGLWLGSKLQDALPQETFRRILLAALFIMALNLIWRGMAPSV
jgi:uncharacterized membrane protein YfcA